MDSIIIFCAKYLLFIVLIAAAGYWLTRTKDEKIRMVLFAIITSAIAVILAKIGGSLFYNARPFVVEHITPLIAHSNDNGFPSDHTLAASALAVTLFAVSKKWSAALFVAALLIGGSRVLAHVHHPVDIIGSMIFAIIGGMAAYYLTPMIMRRLKTNPSSSSDSKMPAA